MQFTDLKAQYAALKPRIDARIQQVLDHGPLTETGPRIRGADRHPLSAAQQDQTQRQPDQPGPIRLGRPRGVAGPVHPRAAGNPDRGGLRGLAFAFAHEGRVRAGRAAPVDLALDVSRHGASPFRRGSERGR